MKKNLIPRLGLIAFMALLPWGSAAQAGPLEDLVAGGQKGRHYRVLRPFHPWS